MPLGPDVKYRFKKGTHTRLAFDAGGDVIEAKNMKTGATHTPAEFAADEETNDKPDRKEEKAEGQKRYFRKKGGGPRNPESMPGSKPFIG